MAHQTCPVVVLVDVLFGPVCQGWCCRRRKECGKERREESCQSFGAFGLCGQASELFQQVKIRMEILYLAARLTLLNNS